MYSEMKYPVDPATYKRMNTQELRRAFLVEDTFNPGKITHTYSFTDRAVIGSAVPTGTPLKPEVSSKYLAADYFLQRREMGIFNIGDDGTVKVSGEDYTLGNREILYVGRGNKEVVFQSTNPDAPAQFYFVSFPAHKEYPVAKGTIKDANVVDIGDQTHSSKRTLYQMIHPNGIPSCQLVMGFTELADGNVWNTMPPHTHLRRSEIYMYFSLDEDELVYHTMGEPDESRVLVIRNGQAVLSPEWSYHAGAGTQKYGFVWAMGGENQDFDDMDLLSKDVLY